ncbi:glycosyltransferase family 8 protein [Plenodomus tracheiphilus IPT5]|uniref:Glycosyltransferase family 8 protein n=1 Tax=Plenodomus tracheiphilus IPT5 TaxID=1408161 RepID=A0A6A7B4I2_9PLEO|nr:glycosyltransferase family 8 protein [Plenodomus tracheiphilus IPT5]
MRRRHNVALSTLLVLGIIILCARDQASTLDLPRSKQATAKTPENQVGAPASLHILDSLAQGEHEDGATLVPLAPVVESSLTPLVLDGVPPSGNEQPLVSDDGEHQVSLTPPSSSEPGAEAHGTALPFQQDLDLELPLSILQEHATRAPHNYNPNGARTYAYATFMATRNPSIHDPYFLAIHSLIYRVLWSPRSRTTKYPFIVFVAEYVTPEQRALLSGAGAIVRELAPVEWTPNVPGVEKRWKDLFAKLNMWREIEFERILFLDADAFPLANIDGMFDVAPVQPCIEEKLQQDDVVADGTAVCEPYVFAGVAQDPWSGSSTDVNVGAMVFTPSLRMHERLLQNYVKTDKYDCLMAEQAFLNWQFSRDGAFPATTLERKWGGVFPKEEEEGSLHVVHEKIWVVEDGWLRREWVDTWVEMVKYYESSEFGTMRGWDGLVV